MLTWVNKGGSDLILQSHSKGLRKGEELRSHFFSPLVFILSETISLVKTVSKF